MDSNSPSGMYKCTECKNVETHIQGKEFLPCTECNKVSWEIIKNPYSRWYRSMSVSKLMIENDQICFPDFFENEYQLKLFC